MTDLWTLVAESHFSLINTPNFSASPKVTWDQPRTAKHKIKIIILFYKT